MVTPDPARFPPGFPLGRIAGWQLAAAFAVAAVAFLWAGPHGALSGLIGGLVSISAGVGYGVIVRLGRIGTAADTVRTLIRAEAAKITLIVLQLWLVLTTYREIVVAALLAGFVVTILVSTAAIAMRD
ncbi:MAG TPA: ATP synthase subunit I [Casimicrobiaceae bacterium]|nr:ATP synthase subunit I [Casimicrobiaceae bacterium]